VSNDPDGPPTAAEIPADDDQLSQADAVAERRQARRERRQLLLRSPAFIGGVLIVGFWVLCAFFPDLFARYNPEESIRSVAPRSGPSGDAWFGTDRIGRYVYSRVIAGAREVLKITPAAAGLGVLGGTIIGLIVGYYRGWVDEVIGRIIDGFLSIPLILLAVLASAVLTVTDKVLVIMIAALFVPVVARTIRAVVIGESDLDYVTSAKLRGESGLYIMTREILPNITGTVVVELAVRVGYAIFTVATLSFLGLVGDIATADWATDINQTYPNLQAGQWWMSIFPAIAIGSLIIGVNLMADSIDRVNKS
jgi:peptide/nickel transport system permease protein